MCIGTREVYRKQLRIYAASKTSGNTISRQYFYPKGGNRIFVLLSKCFVVTDRQCGVLILFDDLSLRKYSLKNQIGRGDTPLPTYPIKDSKLLLMLPYDAGALCLPRPVIQYPLVSMTTVPELMHVSRRVLHA